MAVSKMTARATLAVETRYDEANYAVEDGTHPEG